MREYVLTLVTLVAGVVMLVAVVVGAGSSTTVTTAASTVTLASEADSLDVPAAVANEVSNPLAPVSLGEPCTTCDAPAPMLLLMLLAVVAVLFVGLFRVSARATRLHARICVDQDTRLDRLTLPGRRSPAPKLSSLAVLRI